MTRLTTGHFNQLNREVSRRPLMSTRDYRLSGILLNVEQMFEALDTAMGVFSHSERLMAEFFIALWVGHHKHSLDIVDAAKTLDQQHRFTISR